MEQAMQWWYNRQSKQLTWEAAQIRDCLLQESLAVRRSLELSIINSDKLSINPEIKWIEQFENFHAYLKELCDRLSPPYLEEGLPLALEYLVQKWQRENTSCEFQLQVTPKFNQNFPNCNRIIINALDEILKIEILDLFQKVFIYIDLRQKEAENQLQVTIQSLNSFSNLSPDKCRDLEYLKQSFRVLTSGAWISQTQKSTTTHYLRWLSKSY